MLFDIKEVEEVSVDKEKGDICSSLEKYNIILYVAILSSYLKY